MRPCFINFVFLYLEIILKNHTRCLQMHAFKPNDASFDAAL